MTKKIDYQKAVSDTMNENSNVFWSIFKDISGSGGRVHAVGGWVRDLLMSVPCKDLDVEIFHLSLSQLKEILGKYGAIDLKGEEKGILKINQLDIDFAIPRRERKTGPGHKDFKVTCDPEMSAKEAASRRNFTMNSIARISRMATGIQPKKTAMEIKIDRQAKSHSVDKGIEPNVLTGKHLQKAGFKSGPVFSDLLKKAYEIQIEEGITNPEILLRRLLE